MDFYKPYHNEVALTALALQALARRVALDGTSPELTQSIDRAVAYLLANQDAKSGLFGPEDFTTMVAQSLATEGISLAMQDRMTPEVLKRLKAAVRLLEMARNPYAGWRYEIVPTGDSDSRITGYVLLALARAFDAGDFANPRTIASGMSSLFGQEDVETGRTNYMVGEPHAYRTLSHKASHPAERAEAPTAMHLRLRNDSGLDTVPHGAMEKAIDLLASKGPL
ncbi:MAG: hypothetical protein H6827_08615 [Planctomycetes bacterium]|nr:hypothetical protein [Planctomycetota bacterium]